MADRGLAVADQFLEADRIAPARTHFTARSDPCRTGLSVLEAIRPHTTRRTARCRNPAPDGVAVIPAEQRQHDWRRLRPGGPCACRLARAAAPALHRKLSGR